MSLNRYSKYEPTVRLAIPQKPLHWVEIKLGHVLTVQSGDMVSSDDFKNEGFPIFGGNGFRGFFDRANTSPETLLIGRVGALCGNVHHVKEAVWATEHAFRVRFRREAEVRFYFYVLISLNLNQFAIKTAQPLLNSTIVEQQFIVAPPLPEQRAIADFLDRETAKIDLLVSSQLKLVHLLKEKQLSVISQAVTRGIQVHAHIRPSTIEWLGDVPQSWKVLPLKRVVSVPITDGPHETPNFIDDGVPFVSAEAVSSGQIDFSKVRACISKEDNARYSKKYSPKLHDIYMVKSGATTGITAIVDGRVDFNIWSPLAAIRCGKLVNPFFLLYFLRSRQFMNAVSLYWSFGTQQNIGMGVIQNLYCTVPPISEQEDILKHLGVEVKKFDTLIQSANRVIELLKERRSALITAAVTGQIEVASNIANEAVA